MRLDRKISSLMREASAAQLSEAPIYGYVWLGMELAQQLEELGDLLKVCTANTQE